MYVCKFVTNMSILLLFIFILTFYVISQRTTYQNDLNTLLNLKHFWSNPPSLNHWNQFSNPCTWAEITCTTSTVTGITINYDDIKGTIPPFICDFKNLTRLDLNYNFFIGTFPTTLYNCVNLEYLDLSQNYCVGVIPNDISRLSPKLKYLNLFGNNFTGDIPVNISRLSKLSSLQLHQNRFNGSFPVEIGYLDHLEELNLSFNDFTPSRLPNSFIHLKNLKKLYMTETNLIGEIPKNLSSLVAIELLDLSVNHLTGSIPTDLFLSKNLTELYLYMNNLTGKIPDSIEALNLRIIDISQNKLTGNIPTSFGNLLSVTSLKYLNLDNNLFYGSLPALPINIIVYSVKNNTMTGEMPSSVCSSIFLKVFHVSYNNISGALPNCFRNGSRLTSLNLYNNRLQGALPKSLMNCRLLQVLDVGENMISDVFPTWLDALPELQVLALRANRFHGAVETTSSSTQHPFPKLRILDLSGNLFTGNLSCKYFENFKAMIDIDQQEPVPTYVGGNTLYQDSVVLVVKGLEREFKRILTMLTAIDLSNNKFEGEIPSNIRMLNSLRYLNLSHNHLNGQIPSTFGNLTKLESLDLSSNQIKGKIPSQLTKQTFMGVFNVSRNQLSGNIPQGGQFNTFENNSYQENLALCGFPLLKNCGHDNEEPTLPLSQQHEDETSAFFEGFTWKSVVLGYECGIVLGVGLGCLIMVKGKQNWVLRIVNERKHRSD